MRRLTPALLVLALLAVPGTAAAGTITVTTTADQNDGCATNGCSLREAVDLADTGDDVYLPGSASPYLVTIAPVSIDKSITVHGDGAGATTVSGNDARRPFNVVSGAAAIDATISDMTIRDGVGNDSPYSFHGGAILTYATTQPIDAHFERLHILENNISIPVAGSSGGGAGIAVRTGGDASVEVTILGSTLTGNTVTASSTAHSYGGAIVVASSDPVTVNLVNSTVTDNEAEVTGTGGAHGGAVSVIQGIGGDVEVNLRNATLAANTADPGASGTSDGGSMYSAGGPTMSAAASVITDGNAQGTATDNCVNDVNLPGDNVEDLNTCAVGAAGRPNTDALLDPLDLNGGTTPNHALDPASQAIGFATSCEPADQRGVPRPATGCDAGAFEASPPGVTTDIPSGVTETSATLTGSAAPLFESGSYHFEYGPTTDYGSATPDRTLDPLSGPVTAQEEITGLAPGTTYHYRLVGTNLYGTAVTEDRTFTTGTAPLGGGPGPGPGPIAPPLPLDPVTVTSLRLSPSAFRAAAGTTVRYELSGAGTARFQLKRPAKGRRVNGRCVRRTPSNRRARRCPLWRNIRPVFTRASVAGANEFRFDGRLGGRRLKPGRYRLAIRVRNAENRLGPPKTAQFRIEKPRRR